MSEDLDNKINQIKDLLGKDGMADTLKSLMSGLGKQSESSDDKEDSNSRPQESGMPFDPSTIQMIFKMKNILDGARNNQDPREKLIKALKPYLSDKRQDKVDEVLKILKMTSLMDVMTKMEGSEKNAKSQ